VKKSTRKVIVFTTLVGVLMVTSALLMALAPAPLTPDATNSLFAIDAPNSMDVIFQTKAKSDQSPWKYIYIHHSRTATGNADTLAEASGALGDHFVIGNGDGAVDGEVQIGQRWDQQLTAAPPTRGTRIDPHCISICLIGDFDQTRPTPTQLRRLEQLISTLQAHYHIPLANVALADQAKSPAGIGRFFPSSAFRDQLIP
jgi:hypothetical protein